MPPHMLDSTLGEVRRANLRGSLYPTPRAPHKRWALRLLYALGLIEAVAPTRTSLGGWVARE